MSVGGEKPDKSADRSRASRCVVLAQRQADALRPLLDRLQQRSVEVAVVQAASAVMVQLAGGVRTVIIDDPPGHDRLDDLLAAIARYYPNLAVWSYRQQGEQATLERFASATSAAAAPPDETGDADAGTEAGNGRSDRGMDDLPLPEPDAGPMRDSYASLITPEELAMLIGPAQRRPTGSGD